MHYLTELPNIKMQNSQKIIAEGDIKQAKNIQHMQYIVEYVLHFKHRLSLYNNR